MASLGKTKGKEQARMMGDIKNQDTFSLVPFPGNQQKGIDGAQVKGMDGPS